MPIQSQPPVNPQRRFARLTVAAQFADVHVNTIRNWVARGKLRSYKVGGVVRIDLDELDQMIRSHADGSDI